MKIIREVCQQHSFLLFILKELSSNKVMPYNLDAEEIRITLVRSLLKIVPVSIIGRGKNPIASTLAFSSLKRQPLHNLIRTNDSDTINI